MKSKLIRLSTVSYSLNILLKGQLAFLNQYYDIVAIASGKETLFEVEKREGIRTIEVKMDRKINLLKDVSSLFTLIQVFRKEKPFIVHANTPKGSLLAMIASWVTRVPHRIYTVTGLRFETATGNFKRLLIAMERLTCFCATKVIPEGEGVKKTLQKYRITTKPLHKILNGNINGVDIDFYDKTDEIITQATLLKNKYKGFIYVFVGRIVGDKGIKELIKAFVQLYKKQSDIYLLLVGPFEKDLDPLSHEIERTIHDHPGIIFLDYQNDIRPYLAASDALVFPSYREGFPNVVLQAGAMGLPSIVTDINGCNEIISDGVNGVIIPPKDENALFEAMEYFVINRNTVVKEMAEKARPMIVERFEQQKVWDALLAEYKSLE